MNQIMSMRYENLVVEMWEENNGYHAKVLHYKGDDKTHHTKSLAANREDAIEQAIALFEACIHSKQMLE